MKEFELMAVAGLLEVYMLYDIAPDSKLLQEKAQHAYDSLRPGSTMLPDEINRAVGFLFALAYPNSGSGLRAPTKEEAKKIIKELMELKKKLENEKNKTFWIRE